jgi:CheY-like chemotaxis protein
MLKSDPDTAQIKIIMLSGMAQNSDLKRSVEVSADAYLTKPFSIIVLIDKVEQLLKQSQSP